MAVVEFKINDLERLIGKKLTREDLEEKIPMLGCPLEKIEGEKVHYEIFPNRPDLLSPEGFSRALRFFFGISKEFVKYKTRSSGIKIIVDPSVKDVRPYVLCAVLRNVRLNEDIIESLMQLQEKIHETFGRKRKRVAIGIHDLDKVKPDFVYKAVDPKSISFVPLGQKKKMNLLEIGKKHEKGKKYIHILERSKKWPIILDKKGNVLSFPPIINGELTKVTEKTKNLFIDITGTNIKAVEQALNIVVTSLGERGFNIETVEVCDEKKYVVPDLSPQKISINIDYVNKLLDTDFTEEELKRLLCKMGLGFDGKVLIPPYRVDIMHEIDIVEDIAIAFGYQNFEPKIPKIPTIATRIVKNEFFKKVKEILIGLGLQEVSTMILTNSKDNSEKMGVKHDACELLNSVTIDRNICRTWLLPCLITVLTQNKHRNYPQKIFEIGKCVLLDNTKETKTKDVDKLSVVVTDNEVSYENAAELLDALFRSFEIKYNLKRSKQPFLIDNRAADIIVKNKKIGFIGELHPKILEKWNLEKPVVCFEIDLEDIAPRS
jgi:phenylalanyl-tRNA synthetase beta chain